MKCFNFYVRFLIVLAFILSFTNLSFAQDKVRPSLKASVSQGLGVDANITIDYSRPGVKGRKIWGELIPFGMNPGNKYSKEQPYPWRAGANENTTIECNKDILIQGKKLVAGKYGIHMIPSEKDWVIIYSKKNAEWGSYSYDQNEDALRINVTPKKAAHQEWLKYGFEDLAGTSATAFLHWEELKIPFEIKLAE